jgi:hypothetical protein
MKQIILIVSLLLEGMFLYGQSGKPMSQYPSPMRETVRAHERVPQGPFSGYHYKIKALFPKPIDIYVPLKTTKSRKANLLIHFFGGSHVVPYAADHYHGRLVAVSVNLGAGSSVYARPFSDSTLFNRLLDSVQSVITENLHHDIRFNHILVSGFSAGYGAVRALLGYGQSFSRIDAVLLLDGMHADYIPDRKTLAAGGKIDSAAYENFLNFCREAVKKHGEKRFLFTHSEIFPGTFVSTTESADYLLNMLDLHAHPVLKRGPLGMQQISQVRKNHFEITGFAGNSGPDHIDHLQGLSYFLNLLEKL